MNKKGNKYRLNQPPAKAKVTNVSKPLKEDTGATVNLKWGLMIAIAVITFLCYNYTLKNEFSNWDDQLYVQDNPYVKDLTWPNMKMILLHNITNNYYHPITMLTIAMNYHFAKMSPEFYYFTNVFMHVLNTGLVFLLLFMILEAMEQKGYPYIKGKYWLAAIGGLLYGIHPMHVESVSWLAERKDVMYGFFYFLGLMAYIKYTKEEDLKWLLYTAVLFGCSLLSKPLAVVFPLSLFAFDILLKRNNVKRILIEKAPLLLISLAAGIWAVQAQKAAGSLSGVSAMNLWQRTMFAGYGFSMYIVKAFLPFNLCNYYPYPEDFNNALPGYFYILPLVAIALVAVPVYISYRAGENYFRVTLFGLGFFVINLMFVLQFISSGPAIMADRYTYIAYFGLFMLVIYYGNLLVTKSPSFKIPLQVLSVGFLVMLSVLCYGRTKVWHNSKILWEDAIRQYPHRISDAYNNLGSYYQKNNNLDSALVDFTEAIRLRPDFPQPHINRSDIYRVKGQYNLAITDCDSAINEDKSYVEAYMNRGIAECFVGKFDNALKDFSFVISHQPNNSTVYCNRGNLYDMRGKTDSAFDDYNKAISLDDSYADAYFSRGRTYLKMGKDKEAISDLNKAIDLKTTSNGVYLFRSQAYKDLGDYNAALKDAITADQLGMQVNKDYMSELQRLANSKK